MGSGMGGVVQQDGHGAAGQARLGRVRAAGEDDRDAGAEHDAGQLRAAQVLELLGQHVAALEVGHHEDVGLSGDRRDDA